jgi:acyl-CoA synthetase (NDP forming)
VRAEQIPAILACARGRVRFAQVMSGGFGEVEGGQALEAALVAAAHEGGMRLLGPNCMGTHSPHGRLTFMPDAVIEPGSTAVLSQSGGLSMDILRRGPRLGLAFSGVVSLGNCADIGVCDLLEYFLADAQTRIVGLYVESVKDGRRLFELLKADRAGKPVVVLKGGRSQQGQRAAASHTGALAGDDRAWRALSKQTGAVLVHGLTDFLSVLAAFQAEAARPPQPSGRVVLFGNGGGISVLAADTLADAGLDLAPMGREALAKLKGLALGAGASLTNPIDVPANALQGGSAAAARKILQIVAEIDRPDAVLIHLNVPVLLSYQHVDMLGNVLKAVADLKAAHGGRTQFALVLRSDGEPEVERRKQACRLDAMRAGIPAFDDFEEAATALAALGFRLRFLARPA